MSTRFRSIALRLPAAVLKLAACALLLSPLSLHAVDEPVAAAETAPLTAPAPEAGAAGEPAAKADSVETSPVRMAPAGNTAPVITGSGTGNLVMGLLFLLGLVLFAWWLVRRMGGMQWSGNRSLRVLATLPVGPRERIVLVEVGGEQLLLGVAPGRVSLLQKMETPLSLEGGGGDDFAQKMRQLLQQGLGR